MALNLTVGQLDRQVIVEQRSVARDSAFNSEVVTWSTLATLWAQIVESSTPPASNPGQADALAAYQRPMKIRIRWRADVDTTLRLNYGGRLLQITGTAELGRRQWLELACQEWAHE